jgi:hypothetical protein
MHTTTRPFFGAKKRESQRQDHRWNSQAFKFASFHPNGATIFLLSTGFGAQFFLNHREGGNDQLST